MRKYLHITFQKLGYTQTCSVSCHLHFGSWSLAKSFPETLQGCFTSFKDFCLEHLKMKNIHSSELHLLSVFFIENCVCSFKGFKLCLLWQVDIAVTTLI